MGLGISYEPAADTGTGPSAGVWKLCPVEDLVRDPSKGIFVFEDFVKVNTVATNTTGNVGGFMARTGNDANNTIVDANMLGGGVALGAGAADAATGIIGGTNAFKIIRGGGKVWFEARVKTSTIADNKTGWFIGLCETLTLSDILPLTATSTLADKNIVGFLREEGDGDYVNTTYKADGVTAVTVGSDAKVLVADTFVKLGFYFDGASTLTFYANGVALADTKTIPSAAGTDFPNDVALALCASIQGASTDDNTLTIDWIMAAQERVS